MLVAYDHCNIKQHDPKCENILDNFDVSFNQVLKIQEHVKAQKS